MGAAKKKLKKIKKTFGVTKKNSTFAIPKQRGPTKIIADVAQLARAADL